MRRDASVLHLDLDAFFAAVEQRDKPSLRGKPVVVGGVGGRGVVATASYEARKYGVRSAMSTREARSRCPHAAFLTGRFHAYRDTSRAVMELLRERLTAGRAALARRGVRRPRRGRPARPRGRHGARRSPRSCAAGHRGHRRAHRVGRDRHLQVHRQGRQRPRQARRPGGGPARGRAGAAAADARHRHPRRRPGDRRAAATGRHPHRRRARDGQPEELVRLLGAPTAPASTPSPAPTTTAPSIAERETKSVSVEGTYDTDLTDRRLMEGLLTRQAGQVAERLRKHGLSGRTVTIKVRLHDFTTLNRSTTLPSPTDHAATIARLAAALLSELDTSRRRTAARGGRLRARRLDPGGPVRATRRTRRRPRRPGRGGGPARRREVWAPGMDVVHDEHGPRLGLGLGEGGGDGPVRDGRDPARAGAVDARRRPAPASRGDPRRSRRASLGNR